MAGPALKTFMVDASSHPDDSDIVDWLFALNADAKAVSLMKVRHNVAAGDKAGMYQFSCPFIHLSS